MSSLPVLKSIELGLLMPPIIPAVRRLRWKDGKFKASLSYSVSKKEKEVSDHSGQLQIWILFCSCVHVFSRVLMP
jgi:hypothetical protein